jgi:hypothetical protein
LINVEIYDCGCPIPLIIPHFPIRMLKRMFQNMIVETAKCVNGFSVPCEVSRYRKEMALMDHCINS